MLSQHAVVKTLVTKVMYKENGRTFIGLEDYAHDGEIVRLGTQARPYRVVKLEKQTDREGKIHQIRRNDGGLTTQTDIEQTKVGQQAFFTDRPTATQKFSKFESLHHIK